MTTQVLMLGTGTPNAEPNRVSAGLAIAVDDQPYLLDCGHGIVQRVVEAQAAGKIAWGTVDLNRLFITHLHADHTVGLPDLMFTPWIHGRQDIIQAYGPAELAPMVEHILLAYQENIREHSQAHPATPNGYQVQAHAVTAGRCYQDTRLAVYALPANHGDLSAYSYKFVTADKTIVVSGDTKPVDGFAEWARGCDMLIHEVYSSAGLPQRPAAWQAYHARAHTSTHELAALANKIKPRLLILHHQLFWGATADELLAEIRADYGGEVVSANDLDLFGSNKNKDM